MEAYNGYLYIILHGIDFRAEEHFSARTTSTSSSAPTIWSPSTTERSRSIGELRDHCPRNTKILGEGPVALFHRIVDAMVDRYRPEVDELANRLDELEKEVFENPRTELVREILEEKRDVASLRRVILPQRDVMGRLARRDFVDISTEMSFRFRDVLRPARTDCRRCR